ncbi:PhoD-like phosphatase-domain-containing protein [Bipolaris maydis]|nr:PhoD-like phosphatase-domain-containing protein [Bipolaris maydis]
MLSVLLATVPLASLVCASFDGNLNYHSPSRRHIDLGIDVPKVAKRTLSKRSAPWGPAQLNFTHGVASGDPYPDSVILWTRVAPSLEHDRSNITVSGYVALYNHETEKYIQASPNPICVDYRVGTDGNFSTVVDEGQAYTTSDIDYTVKVEAKNLEPFTQYYYQFSVCGSSNKSPLGRTKTSPGHDDDVSKVGLAVFSCSNWQNGYFNAYGNAARKDQVDFFVHLGDYIYESTKGKLGQDPRATNPPREIVTLYDYRTRIGQYRTDDDLKLAHQNFAWIPTWDDHEIANNGYRDGFSNMNNTEESFLKYGGISVDSRKMNAVRAYFEWMPIRQVDLDDNLRIWRNFKMGKLFDLIILDTRNYDRSITTLDENDAYIEKIRDDAGRSLMGSRQENWFYNRLSESHERGATWRIVGNQIIFSRMNNSAVYSDWLNADQWDVTGDSHANWVSDLVWLDETPYDQATGEGAIGVEFAGTAVSSSGYGSGRSIANSSDRSAALVRDNRELQWTEGYYRGYYELFISPDELNAQYYGSPSVASRNPFDISLANFTVKAGANHLARTNGSVVAAGGYVESGALQRGPTTPTNLTLNTVTGTWNITAKSPANMAATMKAWQYNSTNGGIEKNLQINEAAPLPFLHDEQILVQVHAMALNPVDYKVTEGPMPLRLVGSNIIPGADFCGTVAKVGRKVDEFQIGEFVFGAKVGALTGGTLAQYVVVERTMLAVLPEGVKVEEAAGVGIVGLTEYQALVPNVKSGDKVFINGGSGGTGVFGIQIAKALGCHVTTSCSTLNIEFCKSLGADEVIDYKTTDIIEALSAKGQVFSTVVDNVGAPDNLYKASSAFLLPKGKFVQVGMQPSLGGAKTLVGNMLLPSFLGGGKSSFQLIMAKPSAEQLRHMSEWLKQGSLKPIVDTVFEWEDAPKAFEKLKTGRAKGKIVIRVPQDRSKEKAVDESS